MIKTDEKIYVAGINTIEELNEWVSSGKESTGYVFKRKLDGFIMGNTLHLGMDWSLVHHGLATAPREDKIEYYEEVVEEISEDEIIEVENNESVE